MAERDKLVQELKALRKGRGLSMSKLKDCTGIAEALNTRAPVDTYDALNEQLEQLGDSVEARALRSALGLGMSDPRNLTDRRGEFAMKVDRSIDSVQGYEDKAIAELAEVLVFLSIVHTDDKEELVDQFDIILNKLVNILARAAGNITTDVQVAAWDKHIGSDEERNKLELVAASELSIEDKLAAAYAVGKHSGLDEAALIVGALLLSWRRDRGLSDTGQDGAQNDGG